MHAAMLEKLLSPSARRDRSFIATDGKAGTLPSLAGISEGGLRDIVHITELIGIFELIFNRSRRYCAVAVESTGSGDIVAILVKGGKSWRE